MGALARSIDRLFITMSLVWASGEWGGGLAGGTRRCPCESRAFDGAGDRRRRCRSQRGRQPSASKLPDQPFARVVLPPSGAVAVVVREPVVEVVVTLAERNDRGQGTVSRRRAGIETARADDVRERVHAERGLQQQCASEEP